MDVVSNRTLYSAFAELAVFQPDKEWLIFERADGMVFRWTYAEFLRSVPQAANLLYERGIRRGDVTCLHPGNHAAYPQLILAASYLGAIVTTSNPASTAPELQYVLEHSEAKLLLTQADCLEVAEQAGSSNALIVCKMDEHSNPTYSGEKSVTT